MLKFIFLSVLVWGVAILQVSAQGGKTCVEATTANQGINISNNSMGEQWFKYTATTNGKVIVSSCGQTTADTYVEIFDGCNLEAFTFSNDFCDKQSEVCFEVISGLTYWICWKDSYTLQTYEWFLTEESKNQGEFCSNPMSIGSGNLSNIIQENTYKWFEFTASRNGKITVQANSTDCKIAVFNDCSTSSTLNNDENWNPSITAFEGQTGQSYLIAIRNSSSNTNVGWSITESNWELGERCAEPIDVHSLDNLPINHDSGTDKWYRFIALRDGDITITSANATTEDTYLEVYEGCGSGKVAFSDDAVGMQSELVLSVKANKAYYIKWDNIFQPKQYAWSLKSGDTTTEDPEIENSNIGIYPNPSTGPVNIDLRGFNSEMVTVKVLSLTGTPIKILKLTGGESTPFNLSDLEAGMYQIVLDDLVSRKVVKFLKQ
ncbi:T9SS type A sorting domain-containing protein [Labilibacter marinus]|uniref:T9SS type A sorting domain-containing protein n=1 Tax=Labilibacter marinus TaxID=1477105 RepID=UPI0008295D2E|nr:T9SS type A sorting domain-containing protein [Labilibacter marinus]